MAKLFLKKPYEFENPSRRIFLAGELFESGAVQARKTKEYFKNGESTPEAVALAKSVEKQAEEIRKGTNKQLLDLYVDLFNSFKIPERSNLSAGKETVDAQYEKKGILAVAANICPMLGETYRQYPDLQLLSYATVFNGLKSDTGERADANFLPIGASVWVEQGVVYVSYKVGGVEKTFHSELFPWSSYDEAYTKWLANQAEEAAAKEAEFRRTGRPMEDLDLGEDDPALPRATEAPEESAPTLAPSVSVEALDERSEYEKRLDQKVDSFKDEHGLTEPGKRIGLQLTEDAGIGTYNASLRKPDGEIVSINVRATVPAEAGKAALEQALEKALDDELARLDKTLGREEAKEAAEAPTDLEKDWQRVLESVQKMVAADSRLTGKVTVSEGRRNARGDDKTLIITNTETGDHIQYRVGVREKKAPKSYGPMEGVAADPARIEDAKSIHTHILVAGNGSNNEAIGSRVSKYIGLESYRVSSVEKGAYNAALIMAGIDPIEEPAAPGLIDVLFNGRGAPSERPERERPAKRREKPEVFPLAPMSQIPELLEVYPMRIQEPVDNITDTPPYFGKVHQVEATRNLLTDADAGLATYYVQLETTSGERVTVSVHPDQITDAQVDAYIKANGETLTVGLTRDDVKQYLAYNQLENQLARELAKAKEKLEDLVEEVPEASPTQPVEVQTGPKSYEQLKAERVAAADILPISTFTSPGAIERENAGYKRRQGNEELRAMETQFQDGEFRYLTRRESSMPEPGPDGTVEWKVVYDTAEGQQVTIVGKGSVDTAAVDKYIEASKAMGIEYDRDAMIKYLAYRAVSADFKANTAAARAESGLNEKYFAYVKKHRLDLTDRELASTTADQLSISMRLTADQISRDALIYKNTKDSIVDAYLAPYEQVGAEPFLKKVHRGVNEVNPDGSGLWHVEYRLPDGSSMIVHSETGPVDEAAVKDYVSARNAEGGNYNVETLTQYLGYLRLAQTFNEEWEKQKPKLDEAYAIYKETARREALRQPNVYDFDLDDGLDDSVTVPFEAPSAPTEAVDASSSAPELKAGEYKVLDSFVGLDEPYSGLVEITWPDETFFQGEMKDSVPHGVGVVGLGGADETLGPVEFVQGKATVNLPDGRMKVLIWDKTLNKFNILDR